MPTTSNSSNYTITRDDVINRALRIIGAIGQGETPSTTAVTEAARALNDIFKEWQADGHQIWKYTYIYGTYTSGTASYNIGDGLTTPNINQKSPLKIYQAYNRNTTTNYDTPMLLISRQEYHALGNKASTGLPNQFTFSQSEIPFLTSTNTASTIWFYPTPDATAAANYTFYLVCLGPLYDFDASTDLADVPSFYYNSLVWALADQLAYEYGLPYAERAMITKKAETHLQKALGFDREEGSVFLQPDWQFWSNN